MKKNEWKPVVCRKCKEPIVDAGKTVTFDLEPLYCVGYCKNKKCDMNFIIVTY